MTVTYTAEVATCRGLGCFLKLLRRWRGSIYKLVWLDLIIFIMIYYCLNIMYRFLLNAEQRTIFEKIVKYCNDYSDLIPISFVLGFYVSIVMTRWWNQYAAIPFPDPIAVFVSATIHGNDERGRVMRRSIMRYVCLCVTMMFTMISPRVKKRFPTLDHFVEAGLLQNNEKDIIADLNNKFPKYSKHWLPIVWASSIVTRARKEGLIRDDFAVKTIIDELNKFRGQCGLLINYDNISIPLVYTQVVTLAVYSYFMTCLMAHQWVVHNSDTFDLYFPIFTVLQFFFYMGWLKVAETLINPFGDDDDDFEVNWMIDRNLQVSYLIVDEMHHEHPELVRDQYWDEVFPPELPYTLASEPFRESHPLPSTANIAVNQVDQELSQPTLNSVKCSGDDMQSYSDMITFTAKGGGGRRPSLKRAGSSHASNIGGTSVPDSMSRVASVTSMVKKFFNRENSRTDPSASRRGSQVELNNLPSVLPPSSGSISSKTPVNTMKITDQIIEEVDEQLTITSLHGKHDTHPSVIGLFGPPPPSQPMPIPHPSSSSYMHAQRQSEQTGTSVPSQHRLSVGSKDNVDTISIGCSETDEDGEEDEFTRLKNSRKEERRSRLRLSIARSISHNPTEMEMEYLLLLNQNRRESDGESSPPVKQPSTQGLTPPVPSAHAQQALGSGRSVLSPEFVRQVEQEYQRQAEQGEQDARRLARSLSGRNGGSGGEGVGEEGLHRMGKSDSHLLRKGS